MTSFADFVKSHDQALTYVRKARDCVRHIDLKTREWQQILTLLEIAEGKLVSMEIEREP